MERTGALDAFQHRAVPFSRVVQAVAPERQLGVHPLFQILFSWEPAAPAVTAADGVEFDILPLPAARASYFDLECSLRDAGEGAALSGYFAWSTTALEDWVAEQLPGRLRSAARRCPGPAGRAAGAPGAAGPGRAPAVVLEWNATAAPLPAERSLHESFLAQAARTSGRRGDPLRRRPSCATASWPPRARHWPAELVQRGAQGRNVGIASAGRPTWCWPCSRCCGPGAPWCRWIPAFPPARLGFMARDADLALLLVGGASGDDGAVAGRAAVRPGCLAAAGRRVTAASGGAARGDVPGVAAPAQ